MSAIESQSQDKRLDPGLDVKLPTNNPFRKIASPLSSPRADVPNPKNPFLDPGLAGSAQARSPPPMSQSPSKIPPEAAMRSMNLEDRRQPPPPPPPPGGRGAPPGQAAARLLQMRPGDAPQRGPPGAQVSPRRREDDKQRSPSEERRREERRERRRKEKEEGLKDSQGRPVPSGSSRSKRRGPHLDPIDKLDTTGAFMFGGGYHVSGPYDATVPKHANRKHAPIDAFAKDSLNMVMGGKANVSKHMHASQSNMYGHVDDAVNDYTNQALPVQPGTDPYDGVRAAAAAAKPGESFDPSAKVDMVHGQETTGLGTSTFLDGAPAAASAIRRESESHEADRTAGGGLGRTRSIAQRLKSVRNRDRSNSSGAVYTPEPTYKRTESPAAALSGGGLDRINETKADNEQNPFFNDYDSAYDQKGEKIKAAKTGQVSVTLEDKGSAPAKPAPHALTRSVTEGSVGPSHSRKDSSNSIEAPKQSGGLLGRMKSLRTKKKERSQE